MPRATDPSGASIPFKPGDRVIRKYDGKVGRVHAVYPNDLEDDTEVRFNDGTYTCSNHTKFQRTRRDV
jgi:hypothetical protein